MKKSIYNTPAFRYIFEIIVIVFSVSLSFYIQDVLNEREKNYLKDESLRGVLSDLNSDKNFFKGGVNRIERVIKSIDSIHNNSAGINTKTIHNSSRNYFGFVGSDRNYNSMVSTGAIEFIKNEELQEKINLYYDRIYSFLIDASKQDEKVYNEISKYLSTQYTTEDLILKSDGFFKYVYSESEFKKMQKDKVLKNLLFDKKFNNKGYIMVMKLAIDRSNKLEELIKQELNN
ncbi:MAG: hypothetical protein CBC02_004705 [Flavobacteriaceae bacterium TMED42]|nr:MAG: hypothetical protein CBC02_004705 [Flavobacteriaceae bacterium TMED42]|tara:strand:+ start:706 stop:1398 length:693 start_codon:yes stop_codon:yes gene_type:complete